MGRVHLSCLSKELGFCINPNSLAGAFGDQGQANHAAAAAYEDALTYHRQNEGLKAVPIDLCMMHDFSVPTEHRKLKVLVPFAIGHATIHAMIKKAIIDEPSGLPALPQILLGMPIGKAIQAEGVTRSCFLEDARFAIRS
ncbi:hypothetical protein BJY04DRAFT_217435 [Aspergillus karnatakaensis]|uniref:uncharacterized protein n=1 Tax=Aspergillus karnatakaensis TaxID=1810916 RepID=UPI003CCCA1E8